MSHGGAAHKCSEDFGGLGRTRKQLQVDKTQILLAFSNAREHLRTDVGADAVTVETVSASKFPANREKNRELCPYTIEQETISGEQRILA